MLLRCGAAQDPDDWGALWTEDADLGADGDESGWPDQYRQSMERAMGQFDAVSFLGITGSCARHTHRVRYQTMKYWCEKGERALPADAMTIICQSDGQWLLQQTHIQCCCPDLAEKRL